MSKAGGEGASWGKGVPGRLGWQRWGEDLKVPRGARGAVRGPRVGGQWQEMSSEDEVGTGCRLWGGGECDLTQVVTASLWPPSLEAWALPSAPLCLPHAPRTWGTGGSTWSAACSMAAFALLPSARPRRDHHRSCHRQPCLRCFTHLLSPLSPQQQSCELSFIFYFVLKEVVRRGQGNSPRSHSRVSGSQNSSLTGVPGRPTLGPLGV